MSSSDINSQSSLPESLRPHLFTRPQHHDFLDEAHVPILPPLLTAHLSVGMQTNRVKLPPSTSASLLDLASAAVHQTTIPTQWPICSAAVFHTHGAARVSSLPRINNSPTPSAPYSRPDLWREGESRSSTFAACDTQSGLWGSVSHGQPQQATPDQQTIRQRLHGGSFDGRAPPLGPPTSSPPCHGQHATLSHTLYQHRMLSPLEGVQRNPNFQQPFSLTFPAETAMFHSMPTSTIVPSPHHNGKASSSDFEGYRELSTANYTPPPPYESPSPPHSSAPSNASGGYTSSHCDAQPNSKSASDNKGSQAIPRKRTKTFMACIFCRGRKLKCDGMRPKCKNCRERHLICEYPANVKRRGPGKAPKGSRSRKRGPMISASASKSGKGRPSTRVGGKGKARKQGGHEEAPVRVLDSEGLAPEVRPFTSVLNLWTLEPQMLHAQQIVGEGTRSRATGLEA